MIDLGLKTQADIDRENEIILQAIDGALKGNIHSKDILTKTMGNRDLAPSNPILNHIIDRMTEQELRYNLKTLVNRLDGITTRGEYLHLIQMIDATNPEHRIKYLTEDEFNNLSFDDILDYLTHEPGTPIYGKNPKELTDDDLTNFKKYCEDDKKPTPGGLMPLARIRVELSKIGVKSDGIDQFIDVIKQYQQYDEQPKRELTEDELDFLYEKFTEERKLTPGGLVPLCDVRLLLSGEGVSEIVINRLISLLKTTQNYPPGTDILGDD